MCSTRYLIDESSEGAVGSQIDKDLLKSPPKIAGFTRVTIFTNTALLRLSCVFSKLRLAYDVHFLQIKMVSMITADPHTMTSKINRQFERQRLVVIRLSGRIDRDQVDALRQAIG